MARRIGWKLGSSERSERMRRTVSSRKIVGDETQVAHAPQGDRSDRALHGSVQASQTAIAFEPMSEVDFSWRYTRGTFRSHIRPA